MPAIANLGRHPASTFKPGQRVHFLDLPAEMRNMIYGLALPSDTRIRVREEITGCPMTSVNRQLRAECLPLYLQWNEFHFDTHTNLRDWVANVGEENLLFHVKKLSIHTRSITRCQEDRRPEDPTYTIDEAIQVHSLSTSFKVIKGISVKLPRDDPSIALSSSYERQKRLSYEPSLVDLLRVANRIMWDGRNCRGIWSCEFPWNFENIFRGVRKEAVKSPQSAFKRYLRQWTIKSEPLVHAERERSNRKAEGQREKHKKREERERQMIARRIEKQEQARKVAFLKAEARRIHRERRLLMIESRLGAKRASREQKSLMAANTARLQKRERLAREKWRMAAKRARDSSNGEDKWISNQ